MSHYDQRAEASTAFRAYMQRFELSLLDVALAARVRLLVVWRLTQGLPIHAEHAQALRAGLQRLTGVPYTGRIPLMPAGNLLQTQESAAGENP